jgi:hypothetical protein
MNVQGYAKHQRGRKYSEIKAGAWREENEAAALPQPAVFKNFADFRAASNPQSYDEEVEMLSLWEAYRKISSR